MSDDEQKSSVKTVVHFMGTTDTLTIGCDLVERMASKPYAKFTVFDGGGTTNMMGMNMEAITYFEVIHE